VARLGTVRLRQTSSALVVAFNPDGNTFATGHADGGICIWERSTGRLLHRLAGHTQAVSGLLYIGKGVLVSGAGDRTLRWWDANSGAAIGKVDEPAAVSAMAMGGTAKSILVSSGRTLQVFEIATASLVDELRMDKPVGTSLATIPGDQRIIIGSPDGNIHLIHLPTRQEVGIIPLDTRSQAVVAASPEGRTLAWGEAGGKIRLADVATGVQLKSLVGHLDTVRCLAFSPSGRLLASRGDDGKVRLWNVSAARQLWEADSCGNTMNSLAFSPDGKVLAVARADHSVDLLDAATGKPALDLPGHTDPVYALALSPDGRTLASGAGGLAGSSHDTMRAWDLGAMRQLWRTPEKYGVGARHIAWRADGKVLASCGNDRRIRLWDAADGREVATMPIQRDMAASVAFAPEGNSVLFGRPDGTIGVWHVGDGNVGNYVKLDQVGALSLPPSPPGHALPGGGADVVNASCTDLSPDGRLLVGAFADGNIALWNAATGERLASWSPHLGAVYAVAFLRDGRRFCSAGADTQILVWSLDELGIVSPAPARRDR
jgi:WD40 repeat protein